MTHLFAVSFTNRAMHFAHQEQKNLKSVKAISYPFKFELHRLLDKENLEQLAGLIKQEKDQNNIDDVELTISLPGNYAHVKKVAVPADASNEILFEQVQWELKSYLPEPVENYKVIKTKLEYDYTDYKEIAVICIPKYVIQKLYKFAEGFGASLKELVLDTFSIERYLKSNNTVSDSAVQIVYKIEKHGLQVDMFLGGKYYLSYFEVHNDLSENQFNVEKIVELSKDRLGQIENHLKKLPFEVPSDRQLFFHGSGLDDKLYELFKKDFSEDSLRLPIVNSRDDQINYENANVEVLGLLNYQNNV